MSYLGKIIKLFQKSDLFEAVRKCMQKMLSSTTCPTSLTSKKKKKNMGGEVQIYSRLYHLDKLVIVKSPNNSFPHHHFITITLLPITLACRKDTFFCTNMSSNFKSQLDQASKLIYFLSVIYMLYIYIFIYLL